MSAAVSIVTSPVTVASMSPVATMVAPRLPDTDVPSKVSVPWPSARVTDCAVPAARVIVRPVTLTDSAVPEAVASKEPERVCPPTVTDTAPER